MSKHPPKCAQDNRASQLNPIPPVYYLSRGMPAAEAEERATRSKAVLDNHTIQLNPNSAAYRASRGKTTQAGSSEAAKQSPAKTK